MTRDLSRRIFGASLLAGTGTLAVQEMRTSGLLHDRRKTMSRVAIFYADSYAARSKRS